MLKTSVAPSTLPRRGAFETNALSRLLDPSECWVQVVQLAAVVVAGLVIRIAFIQSAGYRDDVVIFYGWLSA